MTENIARDKQQAAYHEAGHAAIANYCGLDWTAKIEPRLAASVLESCFSGQVTTYGKLTPFRQSAKSWGGTVAEAILNGKRDSPEPDLDYIISNAFDTFTYELDSISTTDMRGITFTPFTYRSCCYAGRLLLKLWPQVEAIAQDLLANGITEAYLYQTASKAKGTGG